MMENEDATGRFLPSRVYSRWKWTVRFGLLIVPMLVLLAGGLVLFLTPSKYQSTALVEIKNGRSPQESVNLLKSSAVLKKVVESLSLTQQLNVDHDAAEGILRDLTEIQAINDTQLIEISVTSPQKELARDIARSIPESLAQFEVQSVEDATALKIGKIDQLIRNASDVAAEKAVAVTKIEAFHGQISPETPAFRELERARRASLVADAEVERLQVTRADLAAVSSETIPRLIIHSAPVIAANPSNPKIGPDLNELILQALASGLLLALLLPYLWELAFPWQKDAEFISEPIDNL